jgi:hypothetical protein
MNQYSFYQMQIKQYEEAGGANLYLHYSYSSFVDVLVPSTNFYHGVEEVTIFGKFYCIKYFRMRRRI